MKKILKSGWFFIFSGICAGFYTFNDEYLKAIYSLAVYFFVEIGILITALKCGALKLSAEVDESDPK